MDGEPDVISHNLLPQTALASIWAPAHPMQSLLSSLEIVSSNRCPVSLTASASLHITTTWVQDLPRGPCHQRGPAKVICIPNSQEVGSLGTAAWVPAKPLDWNRKASAPTCCVTQTHPYPPPIPTLLPSPSCLRKRGKGAEERWPFRSCNHREIICKSYELGQPGASLCWRLSSDSVLNSDLGLIGFPSLSVLSHPCNGTRAAEVTMATTCIQQIFIEL